MLLCLGVGVFFLGEGADIVHQVPGFLHFEAGAFGGHIVVAVLDDVEDFTVCAVFQRVRVGEIHHRELHFLGGLAFAVTSLVVAHFAVHGPPFFGAAGGLGRRLHRILLLGGFDGNRGVTRILSRCVGGRLLRRQNRGGDEQKGRKNQCQFV